MRGLPLPQGVVLQGLPPRSTSLVESWATDARWFLEFQPQIYDPNFIFWPLAVVIKVVPDSELLLMICTGFV